ncbi:MAG: hypothetical protein WBD86_00445 [Microgenomates group bacterium]
MLETPHIVVGAAIATKVVNPALAIPLAFGSHFLLERVPHWNPHLNTEKNKFGKITKQSTRIVIVDATIACALAIFIASRALPDINHTITILAASFFSALPDIIEGPYFFFDVESKFIKKWIAFQKSIQADAEIIPGLLTQIITIAAAFLWILA